MEERKAISNLTNEEIARLLDGTYTPPEAPPFNLTQGSVFLGLVGANTEKNDLELTKGLVARKSYAKVFGNGMLSSNPPVSLRAPSLSPWQILYGNSLNVTINHEIELLPDAETFGLPRAYFIRVLPIMIRLCSGQPVFFPTISNQSFEVARNERALVRIIQHELVPTFRGTDVLINEALSKALKNLFLGLYRLRDDADIERAMILIDTVWWQPTAYAQLAITWTVIELLMRPGRKDTTKNLARAVRKYSAVSRSEGDRLYQDVCRLYESRGFAVHAGIVASTAEFQESFMILRTIMLRALLEGVRPPLPEEMTPLYSE